MIFEWLTGGGLWHDGLAPDPTCPFQVQGRKMLTAVAEDFSKCGCDPIVPLDSRLELPGTNCKTIPVSHTGLSANSLVDWVDLADFAILIAPETDGCLLRCANWISDSGRTQKLLSPDATFIKLTSDKNELAFWLFQRGVLVPSITHTAPIQSRYVMKPAMGAGSEGIQLLEQLPQNDTTADYRVEPFVQGRSASVSVLCGRKTTSVLSPTWQILDGICGPYLDSELIECEQTAARAAKVAEATIRALPATVGYVGIDMVIGEEEIFVVDVNPRLTTSYCKLRTIEPCNLAEKMLELHLTP